jgi:hypothetical protein
MYRTYWQRLLAAGLISLLVMSEQAVAQGMSPMQKEGKTLSDKKLFRITLINPYAKEMRYELSAEDRLTKETQPDVKFTGRQGVLPPKNQRKVLVLIPVAEGRRQIRVCLQFPDMQETIRPRVCSDLTAIAVRSDERQRRVYAPASAGGGG